MSYFEIPIEDAETDGAFYTTVTLDGSEFQLNFQYNEREEFWYFDLYDSDGEPVRTGVKVVSNFPLVFFCQCMNKPLGELMSVDTDDEPQDPGLEEFGVDSVFSYVSEESVPT